MSAKTPWHRENSNSGGSTTGEDQDWQRFSTTQGGKEKVFNGQKSQIIQHSQQIFYILKATRKDNAVLQSVTINKFISKAQKLNAG